MNIKELADTIVTTFASHGVPKGNMSGTQPENRENIQRTNDIIIWAFKNK